VRAYLKQQLVEWGIIALMAILCGILTLLQYHWTGEISRAEAERLQARTQSSAESLCRSFDQELATHCAALVPVEGSVNNANRASVHQRLFEAWRAQMPRPLFSRIAVAVPSRDGIDLLRQDLSTGRLSPMRWPIEWRALYQRYASESRGGGGSSADPRGIVLDFTVFGRSPGNSGGPPDEPGRPPGGPPGDPGRPPGDFGGRPESEWVIFELNTNHLQGVWLPQLAAEYLNLNDRLNDVILRTIASPAVTLFTTSSNASGRVPTVSARLNRSGRSDYQGGPRGNPKWSLDIYPVPNALENLISASRKRNFAAALLLNSLILATSIILVRLTRRSRRLAEQQMSFVAGVSHELRTPLTVIRGAAHNLKRGVISDREQVVKYSGLIIQQVEQLGDMIEQVLALAGARKNHAAAVCQPVALNEVLRDALDATVQEAREAQCEVQMYLPPALPKISGDAAALRRAFQNLIGNAVKHAASGRWVGITVVVDEDCPPNVIEVVIADRGPGIPSQERSEVFKPFFRGVLARSSQIRGSGLGLCLVKETVQNHGGTISVRDTNGGGATFVVRLPLAAAGGSP
jgi:signal transduction histidine kinase